MDSGFKEYFLERWNKYFPGCQLPITFYYTDNENDAEPIDTAADWHCVIADLGRVLKGRNLRFDADTIGCFGGKEYLGYSEGPRKDFEYFLSCGIPGEMDGIRFKKSPELVKLYSSHTPPFKAPAKYIVFKRWDRLDTDNDPIVVIFFAVPDTLSGLFSLANFDESDPLSVLAPSCAGCASIVRYPYMEYQSGHPRGVIGMFDLSARVFVKSELLTFSLPITKFSKMIKNMDESFLITDTWNKLKKRL